jgi:diguanylate cyclase (GGDEF)-like protein/PAS domain S-box-containing protein
MHVPLSSDEPREPVAAKRAGAEGRESLSALDRIARLAALSVQAPAAAISLFRAGRLEPAAVFGLVSPTEQEVGEFADVVVEEGRCTVVADTRADSRFRRRPRVAAPNGFRFCAGAPIRTGSGWTLGVLSVFDRAPRQFQPGQILTLSDFADLIAAEVSARMEATHPAGAVDAAVSHDRAVALFEDSNDVGLIYGFDGQLLALNGAAERATGYSKAEALERRIEDLVTAEQRPLIGQAVLAALGGAIPEDREFTFLTKDNRRFVLEVRSRLVFQSGRPIAVQAVGRDVTRRRRAEQQRDRSASELARFSTQLRQLHRLSTTSYDSLENLIRDHLRTGCDVFGLTVGRLVPAGTEAPIVHCQEGSSCNGECETNLCSSIRTSVRVDRELFGELCFCSHDGPPRDFSSHETEIIELMARSIANSVSEARMRAQLAFQATHDPLTGLFNRSYQQEWLDRALLQAAESGTLVADALLDLDRFKQVNDIFGHSFGDVVLKRVAERMIGLLDPNDTLARMGGDEFTVVLTRLKEPAEAIQAAQRLLAGLRRPFDVDEYEFVVTASLGLSFYPADARDAATLLRQADAAMFRAKNRGKNDVECFTPEPSPPGFDRLDLETQLRRAVDNREFELLFQPQVDLRGGLHGLEVLLVWNSPKFGRVLPGRFIPIAEECGLIVSIGTWVLMEACTQGARWHSAGAAPVRIAVNVSSLQFARTDFVETVAETLRSTGFPPGWLELEITESLIMRDVDEAVRRMARLRALGVSIAIDDFGTGYSSLSYLRQLPVDALKIDRSFMPEIESAAGTLPLVQTIISLAHDMGLRVLAEGVENDRQARLLYAAGCDRAQGHFFGEPLTAAEVGRLPCRGLLGMAPILRLPGKGD